MCRTQCYLGDRSMMLRQRHNPSMVGSQGVVPAMMCSFIGSAELTTRLSVSAVSLKPRSSHDLAGP
eukprot:2476809-Amphidinium_carterae.1